MRFFLIRTRFLVLRFCEYSCHLLTAFVQSRILGPVLAAVCVFLLVPTVFVGFRVDDYLLWGKGYTSDDCQREESLSSCEQSARCIRQMYAWFDTSQWPREELEERGIIGWHATSDLHLSFFRPVAAVTHLAEGVVWPNCYWCMHATSLIFYALLIIVATETFRKILGKNNTSAITSVLFAFSHIYIQAATWISARSNLLGPIFVLLSFRGFLEIHSKTLDNEKRVCFPKAVDYRFLVSLLWFVLSLLSHEGSVSMLALLGGWSVFLANGSVWRRLRAIIPYLTIIVLWRIGYREGGFGARGTALYTDPFENPLIYLEYLPKYSWGFASELVAPLKTLSPFSTALLLFFGAVTMVQFHTCRGLRFFALSTIVSLIPLAAATPVHGRTLVIVTFLWSGWLGSLINSLSRRSTLDEPCNVCLRRMYSRGRLFALTFIVLLSIVYVSSAALRFPNTGQYMTPFHLDMSQCADAAIGVPNIENKDLILIDSNDAFCSMYFYGLLKFQNRPAPKSLRVLGMSTKGKITFRREGTNVFTLLSKDGGLLPRTTMYRDAKQPLKVGDAKNFGSFSYEIKSLNRNGEVQEVQFRFSRNLDSPNFVWCAQMNSGYRTVRIPLEGNSVEYIRE